MRSLEIKMVAPPWGNRKDLHLRNWAWGTIEAAKLLSKAYTIFVPINVAAPRHPVAEALVV